MRRTIFPILLRVGSNALALSVAGPRTAQSFCVPKPEIAAAGYDLSINRFKEVAHEAAEHRPPTCHLQQSLRSYSYKGQLGRACVCGPLAAERIRTSTLRLHV